MTKADLIDILNKSIELNLELTKTCEHLDVVDDVHELVKTYIKMLSKDIKDED